MRGLDDIEVLKGSEHGLGLYLDPYPKGAQRDSDKKRIWIKEASRYTVEALLGLPAELPPWHHLPALTRFTISSPHYATWFRTSTNATPEAGRPRPGGFGLMAHPDGLIPSLSGALPAAPYTDNSDDWLTLPWYDRRTGSPIPITTLNPVDHRDEFDDALAAGAVRVRTLGDILASHLIRPEHKALAPDAGRASGYTRGLLRRRPVHSSPLLAAHIGKEAHRLDRGPERNAAETSPDYGTGGDEWRRLIQPVLATLSARQVADAVGITPRRAREWIRGRARPHSGASGHYARARELAVAAARASITSEGFVAPKDDAAAIYIFLVGTV